MGFYEKQNLKSPLHHCLN